MDLSFEIPPFAARCMEAAVSEWQLSFKHPFLQALLDGSLGIDRFRFYQMQDARYLEAYADACTIISTRIKDTERKRWFIDGARLTLDIERELHKDYGKKLRYTKDDIANLELSPNNRAYQNHLLVCAQKETLLTAVAALAPCSWLYSDIGFHVTRRFPDLSPNHPYAAWLKTYVDPIFVNYTNELLAHLQSLANQFLDINHQREAIEAFVLSTRYELMFWDQAWNLQGWHAEQEVRGEIELERTV